MPSPRKAEKVARSIRDVDEVVTRFEKAAATNAVDGISGIGEYIRDALGRVVVEDGLSRMRSLEGSGARMTKHLSLKPAGTHKRLRPPPIDLQIEHLGEVPPLIVSPTEKYMTVKWTASDLKARRPTAYTLGVMDS